MKNIADKKTHPVAAASPPDLAQRLAESNTQLHAVQKELESFAYSVSHDLRAPLIHIGGFVDLLHNHAIATLDEKSKHYLQTITTSTYQLGRMIDEILSVSRISQAEIHKVPIDLESMVQDLADELRPVEEERKITWVIGELPTLHADPTLLRQVMEQLMSNALKFTRPRADTRIEIDSLSGDGEVTVFIRDNGVGFDMKRREKLFGMFQRLHSSAEFEGAGVGLTTVRRIVERHGGRVWAEGVPGAGATFSFALPDGANGFS